MTKEQIEKAANIEMLSHYADEEYPWGIKDIQSDFIIEAFSKGAQWRINSVWHDARKDVPKEFIPILVERDDFTFSVNMVGGNMTSCPLHWVHWAYVIDLLPERKEETE